jgi:hypothetical protein
LVVISAGGCADNGGGGRVANSAFATPEATLDTLKKAGMNKDFDTFVECLSDSAVLEMAGQLRAAGTMLQAMGGLAAMGGGEKAAQVKDMIAKMDAHMKKHVPADAPAVNMMSMSGGLDGGRAAAREAGQAVTDRRSFVAGFLKVMAEQATEQPVNNFSVSNVNIDGETATASVRDNSKGQDSLVTLRRENGLWKVDDFGKLGMSSGPAGGMPGGGSPPGTMPAGTMPRGGMPRGGTP